jgi:hypothetical protein
MVARFFSSGQSQGSEPRCRCRSTSRPNTNALDQMSEQQQTLFDRIVAQYPMRCYCAICHWVAPAGDRMGPLVRLAYGLKEHVGGPRSCRKPVEHRSTSGTDQTG